MNSASEKKCVLALGFFDGVHLGHAALMERTVSRARELGVESAVMTFDTHPDTLVLGKPVGLINSAIDRAYLIRRLFGIDRVEFFTFTEETMRMPWRDFLDNIRQELGAVHFVVGYDFRFGWKGEGNTERLTAYCKENGLGCDVIGQVTLDGIPVSSTYLRTLVAAGDMERAERFMGHPYVLTDTVRMGHRLGRRLGAPTVNMQFAPGVLIPRCGVYASRVRINDEVFGAVTNIGVRPSVSEDGEVTVETHLLDFSGNLYGRSIVLELVSLLRDERKFDDLAALSAQIAADAERARRLLEGQA